MIFLFSQGVRSFHIITAISFLIAVWNICLVMASCWGRAVIWMDIVLASQGLGVQGLHINANRHIKEIYGCVLRASKHRDVLQSVPQLRGEIIHSIDEQECFSFLLPAVVSFRVHNIPLSLIVLRSQTFYPH